MHSYLSSPSVLLRLHNRVNSCSIVLAKNDRILHSGNILAAPGLSMRKNIRVQGRSSIITTAAASGFPFPIPLNLPNGVSKEEDGKWLRQFEPFNALSDEAMKILLKAHKVQNFPAGKEILRQGDVPDQLIIVREGTVECTVVSDDTKPVKCITGPGGVYGMQEILLSRSAGCSVKTDSEATVWLIPRAGFMAVAAACPELTHFLLKGVSSQLDEAEAALKSELERQRALQPYLVAPPKRGIIGNSRFSKRVRKDLAEAAHDEERGPVCIFGEPGLRKVSTASLIHADSDDHSEPMVFLECDRVNIMNVLLGRGSKPGLLHYVGRGTILLNNVHKVPQENLGPLVELVKTTMARQKDPAAEGEVFEARFMFTSEKVVAEVDNLCKVIKVPPLRVRPADVVDMQEFLLRDISRRRGLGSISLAPEAVRRLEAYAFPDNITELEGMLERAVVQSKNFGDVIPEDVFWFAAQSGERFRWSFLNLFPILKNFLRSPTWPDQINFNFTAYVFPVYIALLMFGPQDREHNFGLNLFWAYWWPVMYVVFPFLGRIWCSVCPFMIYGELVQRWRLAKGAVLKKWPHELPEMLGPWFLYGLFLGILVWEEVWDLPNHAVLSAYLLLLITAGAVICSSIFERRFWCRHLCPIGGMNGLMAKLSMTELRARQGICSGNCTTYHCFKGGPAEGKEGLETTGCPLYSHPAQLVDNSNCTLCMVCLKACPHHSVEFRLRPPGIDLWTTHKPRHSELAVLFLLLAAVYVHRLPELAGQLGIAGTPGSVPHLIPFLLGGWVPGPEFYTGVTVEHILVSTAILSAPGLIAMMVHAHMHFLEDGAGGLKKPDAIISRPFLELGYGYLPLAWAGTLAHYQKMFLYEAGRVLPAAVRTVGIEDVPSWVPDLVAHHSVVSLIQGTTLIAGLTFSLILTRKIASRPWVSFLPHCALQAAFFAEFWALIIGH